MEKALFDLHIAAGREAGRDRTCGTKIAYPDEDAGLRAAVAMNTKPSTKKPLEAYPCAFCGAWHLGRAMSMDELQSHMPKPGASLAHLVGIMDRLLAPDGCPWDREQTLDSLRPFLVEETYEVIDALVRNDVPGHCEELGDLLMQIVFQSAIRRAQGAFTIDDVVASISDKLVRRHPHVFANTAGIDTADKVLAQWDKIKETEKPRPKRILDGVPNGPALARAQKLGSKAGKVGFDWPGWTGSFAKVKEEVDEIEVAAIDRDKAAIESDSDATRSQHANAVHHELGDLLLAVVNLARKLGVDAENALVDATDRFRSRFEFVEDRLNERGKTPQQSSLDEMDSLWNDAKRAGIGTSDRDQET